MGYLYLLSEDDSDDIFFSRCLAKITGKSYEVVSRRLRKRGGISEVRKKLPLLIKQIQQTRLTENIFFLIAIDNDRSPLHPEHRRRDDFSRLTKQDQKKSCRLCEIERLMANTLGFDRNTWSVQGTVAIPVEMIESWQLLICEPQKYIEPIWCLYR
ncbi:MAG: hypothetical protein AAFR58_19670, partial [Cyanobacteria bacterium J06627_28]